MLQLQQFKSFRLSLKRILFGSLSGGIGILGLLFAGAIFVVETLTRPKKLNSFDLYTFSPYELGLPAEAVSFPPLHGNHKVNGYYIPCPGATTTILVCPGFRSRMAEFLGIGAHLWKAGHNVLVFEYYGHGIEVGTPLTLGYREINDFLGAVAYAKERAPQNHFLPGALGFADAVRTIGVACTIPAPSLIVRDWSPSTAPTVSTRPLGQAMRTWSTPVAPPRPKVSGSSLCDA